MEDFASHDFVKGSISEHTLGEREYCDGKFSSKKYEQAMIWIIVTIVCGVLFNVGSVAIPQFTSSLKAPVIIDSTYGK
jgi:hypothetical protein